MYYMYIYIFYYILVYFSSSVFLGVCLCYTVVLLHFIHKINDDGDGDYT